MKTLLSIAATLLLCAGAAFAEPRTVTLAVPGMNCAACPITVKKALVKVSGVSKVDIDLGKRQAVVTFDDGKTTVAALTKATTDAGYPSTVKDK